MGLKHIILASAALGAAITAQPAFAHDNGCDEACLTGIMDDYFNAVAAHDSSQLALTADIKYTENGQQLALSDGLWNTAKAVPSYRFNIADAHNGEIAMLGIIDENGNQNFISTRLRIENKRISEIENLIVRNVSGGGAGPGFTRIEQTEPLAIFREIEPEEKRLERHELQAIANSYFTGLDSETTGENVLFDPQCQRMENASWTANSPNTESSAMAQLDCKSQFDTGFQVIVTNIRARRFPVIDETRGLVYALAFFDHAGSVPAYGRPDGTVQEVSGTFAQPFSFIIAEVFKVKDGKLRQIEAVLGTVPYGMKSGW